MVSSNPAVLLCASCTASAFYAHVTGYFLLMLEVV
jgi:hypothetical protein